MQFDMKSTITLALAVFLLGTCSARIGGAGSPDGSNMESITVLRDFDEAGIGSKATKAKLSKIKEQLDDNFELKTLRYELYTLKRELARLCCVNRYG